MVPNCIKQIAQFSDDSKFFAGIYECFRFILCDVNVMACPLHLFSILWQMGHTLAYAIIVVSLHRKNALDWGLPVG